MDGFLSTDGEWAAIPFGNQYMIIHDGKQLEVFDTIEQAKKYISVAKSKLKKKTRRPNKGT